MQEANIMSEPTVNVDPEIMNGTPCFRGTRVPFKNLLHHLTIDLRQLVLNCVS